MPDWSELHNEVIRKRSASVHDSMRRRYIKSIENITSRNVIVYYSGWLQKTIPPELSSILDVDKTGFMTAVHNLDRKKGLDLVLHTPGGDMAATESIIDYLRAMFGNDIRAIVPQMAMSGGSMIACACKEIIMGAQSSIGPFDPQMGNAACQAILDDLKSAYKDIKSDPIKTCIWGPILQKYSLGFFSQCEKAIQMADEVVTKNLEQCMFYGEEDAKIKAEKIVKTLGSHAETKIHARHIHKDYAKSIGLKIIDLESDQKLQEAVLSLHHAYVLTFEQTPAVKIIENSKKSYIRLAVPTQHG